MLLVTADLEEAKEITGLLISGKGVFIAAVCVGNHLLFCLL